MTVQLSGFPARKYGFSGWLGGLLFLFAAVAMGQQPAPPAAPPPAVVTPITLPQVITQVLRTHPLIEAARQQIAVAEGVQAQASSWASPVVSYTRSKVTNKGGISELLEFPGKRRLRSQAASIGIGQSREQLRQVQVALTFECRRAFAARLLADRQLQSARQTRQAVEQIEAAARKQFQAGGAARLQVVQAEVELARAQQQVRAAQGQRRVATIGLNVLLGRSIDAPLNVAGDLAPGAPLPPFAQVLTRALQSQPQVVLAGEEADRRQKLLDLARKQKFPNLNLGVTYGSEEGVQTPGIQAAVAIPLPGFYHGQEQAALGQKLAAVAAVESARYQITEQVATAYQQWLTARAEVRTYRSGLLQQSARMLAAAQESYGAGESGLLNVIDAQRTDLLVRQQYEQALYALNVAAAQVRYAAGGLR